MLKMVAQDNLTGYRGRMKGAIVEETNRWKLLLDELGMSQVRFAEKVGVGKSHISKLVSGDANASGLLLFAVEQKFGVSPEWLEDGEGPMFSDVSAERRRVLELVDGLTDEQAKAVSAFIRCLREEGL